MFDKLKQVAQAMSPGNIKRGIELSRQSLATGGQLTEEQRAAMTPDQRAQYDAALQQSRETMAANADQIIEAERARRVLWGPAGDHLYGPMPDRERMTDVNVRNQWEASRAELWATLRNPLGRKAPPPPPLAVSGGREARYAAERALRDEARTPYLAPDRAPVVMTRIATDRQRTLHDLASWLGAAGLSARPDLVYGVYRVPDHVVGGWGIRKPALVEWEVVHAAAPGLPAAPPATVVHFDARDRWAARRPGEPSILDEDLGLEYLRSADLGPEQSLGVARFVDVDAAAGGADSGGGTYVVVGVTGLVVLHPSGVGDGAAARLQAQRPLQVLPAPDVHVAVLNWGDVRRVVAPRPDRRHLVPSPFPHLPSTGAELLESYLAIVGIRPQDCYSAQVTLDQPTDILGGTAHVVTTGAEAEVAADGESRKRFRGGSRVVVAYRDDPDYAAGRTRFAAYQQEALQTTLEHRVAVREPVDRQSALDRGVLGTLVRGAEAVGSFVEGDDDEPFRDLPHYRYCWPPVQ